MFRLLLGVVVVDPFRELLTSLVLGRTEDNSNTIPSGMISTRAGEIMKVFTLTLTGTFCTYYTREGKYAQKLTLRSPSGF